MMVLFYLLSDDVDGLLEYFIFYMHYYRSMWMATLGLSSRHCIVYRPSGTDP